jgi:hypothetical protein
MEDPTKIGICSITIVGIIEILLILLAGFLYRIKEIPLIVVFLVGGLFILLDLILIFALIKEK